MSQVTFKGAPVKVNGTFPAPGSKAPDFKLTAGDLSDKTLADYAEKKKLLSIVPSLDTPVCAMSAKKFNEAAGSLHDAAILNVSADLPFAAGRFCGAEGVKNVETLSTFRSRSFAADYGVEIAEGPLAGLTARAIVVIDENGKVTHSQLVSEITEEPDYDAALAALKG